MNKKVRNNNKKLKIIEEMEKSINEKMFKANGEQQEKLLKKDSLLEEKKHF
jgi:hypothetical protein